MKLLPILVILGSCTLGWGAGEGFESGSVGQVIGSQEGWQGSAVVSDEESAQGEKSLKVSEGQFVSREGSFQDGIVFGDFYLLPVFDEGHPVLNVSGARMGFRKVGNLGQIVAFAENEETVIPSDIPLSSESGDVENWVRFTVRIDKGKREWDLFIDGKPLAASQKLEQGEGFRLDGTAAGSAYLDDLSAGRENLLFVDNDHDGMPDAEELAYGLNPFVDDRESDLDGDGVSNAKDYFFRERSSVSDDALAERRDFVFVDNLKGNDGWSGAHSYSLGGDGPKATLKAAMKQAPSGAVIYVLKGTGVYDEGSRGAQGKELTIKTIGGVTIK